MSQQHDQEYFSDGIAEELLNRLAQIPELRVAARTSAFQFKGKNLDIADIGHQLNVANVLEGSVRKNGTRLRITAQLINSASGFHLWSQTFEGDAGDVFKVQDDIATAIADVLQAKLIGRSGALKPAVAVDPQAYDDYLQGRAYFAHRDGDNLKLAVAAFDRAIARDPDYAAAHAGRASALAVSELWAPWMPIKELVAQSRDSADRALQLDPDNVEALVARSIVAMYHFDIEGARNDLERAFALAPENVDVLNFYGDFLLLIGDLRAAERMKRQAMALDPLAWVHPKDLGLILSEQMRSREALDMLELGAATGYPGALNQVLREQLTLKQFDAAERTRARVCLMPDTEGSFCPRAGVFVLAATGKLDEARASMDKHVKQNPPATPRDDSNLASIYANYLHDIPKATQAARRSLEGASLLIPLTQTGRGALLPEEISQDPEWLAVWADPKLRPLMDEYRKNLIAFRKGD
jgi:TolB-like protein/cytochrome c-type biogenesis protein CcmH/NrfG